MDQKTQNKETRDKLTGSIIQFNKSSDGLRQAHDQMKKDLIELQRKIILRERRN